MSLLSQLNKPISLTPKTASVALLALVCAAGVAFAANLGPPAPKVGQKALPVAGEDVSGGKVELKKALAKGPVVLVFLRGYPGYQCPICSVQVGDLVKNTGEFKAKNAQVILVYPGPAQELKARAKEFAPTNTLGEPFHLLLDPDYGNVNKWGVRWNAPGETAYPSAFVIGKDGVIKYAKVSRGHGDRATAKDILAAL